MKKRCNHEPLSGLFRSMLVSGTRILGASERCVRSRCLVITIVFAVVMSSAYLHTYATTPTVYRYSPTQYLSIDIGASVIFNIGADDSDGDLWAAEWYLESVSEKWDPWSGTVYYHESSWTHRFNQSGKYHVYAYVYDRADNEKMIWWEVTITNHVPVASRQSPSSGSVPLYQGDSQTFVVRGADTDGNLKGVEWYRDGAYTGEWDAMSGSTDIASRSETFPNAGTYEIRAIVYDQKDECDAAVWSVQVTEKKGSLKVQVRRPGSAELVAGSELNSLELYKDGSYQRRTDPSTGEYTFSDLSPGHTYRVDAYGTDMFIGSTSEYISPGENTEKTITAPTYGTLQVRTYYADGTSPLLGAYVEVRSHEDRAWRSGTSGSDGWVDWEGSDRAYLFPNGLSAEQWTIHTSYGGESVASPVDVDITASGNSIENITTTVGVEPPTVDHEFFDDFSYAGAGDPKLTAHGWHAVGDGPNGPSGGGEYLRRNLAFEDDLAHSGNRVMTLTSSSDNTAENMTHSRLETAERRFLYGTYAARVRFTNTPRPYGDKNVQTFYAINYLYDPAQYPEGNPDYSECDFEYLAYNFWGGSCPEENTMWMSTYETFVSEDPWEAVKKSTSLCEDFQGWHYLMFHALNEDQEVTYFVADDFNGQPVNIRQVAVHGGEFYPETLMQISFANWLLAPGTGHQQADIHQMKVDWLYHAKDTALSFSQVNAIVLSFRDAGVSFTDTMPTVAPQISVTPGSVDFGSVEIGQYADRMFTVQNTSSGILTGNASTNTPFRIVSGGSYSLNAGESQVVTVRFSPTAAATHNDTVIFIGGGGATRQVTGNGVACTYSLSSSSHNFSVAGGSYSFNVTTSRSDCTWMAQKDAAWITITSCGSGPGSKTLQYQVAGNTGNQRTGHITIEGKTHTVTQDGPSDIVLQLSDPEYDENGTVTINGYVGPAEAHVTRLSWDWGDGPVADSWFPATHQYRENGDYTVRVTAYTDSGSLKTVTRGVTVDNVPSGGSGSSTHTYGDIGGWYMVSVPLNSGTASELFGNTAYRWNPATGQYDIPTTIEPTKGYWVNLSSSKTVTDSGSETATDVTIDISTAGWYQVSTPWNYPKSEILVIMGPHHKTWTEAVAAGWVRDTIYAYHASDGNYTTPTTINPWDGVWVKALVNDLNLELLHASRTPVAPVPPPPTAFAPTDLPAPPSILPGIPPTEVDLVFTNIPNPITDVHTTTFVVTGPMSGLVEAIKVQIFDLSGRLVYESGEIPGTGLDWHTDNDYGECLANGVYLYRMYAKIGGEWIESKTKKLAILR